MSGGGAKGAFQVGVVHELIVNRGVRLDIVAGVYGDLANAGGDGWLTINPLDEAANLRPPDDIAATVWQHPALSALSP